MDDSAGRSLAAAVTQMARDRTDFPVCFQMLSYPVTDSRQITKSVEMFIDTPI
ncbi:alpha/beta hydrolase fold domain-containing protein [Clostridium estertheticum]|uniref:alpha/beta hydrolase fold domain-containing protein n=1 Tax=Clostridium estertheticum TaxID=238834 RepID=UPI001C0C31C7|nr:alpha/beta hydrolase fold domain-containing protein [Clostridium estertheticum]MBU3156557.1 alpha/beta hydrolase [Clostridium estertheticum]